MNKFLTDLLNEIKTQVSVNLQSELDAIGTAEQKQYPENVNKLKDFFQIIEKAADLDGETIQAEEEYWDAVKYFIVNTPSDSIWNETLNNLVKTYKEIYDIIEEPTVIYKDKATVTGKIISTLTQSGQDLYKQTFNTDDLKNGDAGKSFGDPEDVWVEPWYSTDPSPTDPQSQQSYSYVRGNDKNLAALNSDINLQFTRDQMQAFADQIRLIMPKNTRRVEIEDLNRDFWVIAQILTGITAYLFGDESPFNKLFSTILKELISLWENILYQWVETALLLTPASTIHKEFFPLPNSPFQPYEKFDGFDGLTGMTHEQLLPFIQQRVAYYKYKYTNSNLVLIPYIRINNYEKNYFYRMLVPYICFYNRGTDKWSYCKIIDAAATTTPNYPIINPNNFADRIYAARETDCYYKYTYPATFVAAQTEPRGPYRYHGAFRVEPNFEAKMVSGKLQIPSLVLTLKDGIQGILGLNEDTIFTYESSSAITEDTQSITLNRKNIKPAATEAQYISLVEEKQKGAYYLGEMPSCYGVSSSKPVLVYQSNVKIIGEGHLFKIGNYLPKGYLSQINNPAYCAEQRNPNNELTDYIWNLTIPADKGGDLSTIQTWYNHSNEAVQASDCYLYYPVSDGTTLRNTTDQLGNQDYREPQYRQLGQDVISNFLAVATVTDAIHYYVAAVGIYPWHNWTTEGYYASNVLTHVFRYIPKRLESFVDIDPIHDIDITKNGVRIGKLQTLGPVNRLEFAFYRDARNDIFLLDGTTWRLPQLIPEEYIDQLLVYKEEPSGTIYFVDRNKDASLATLPIDQLTERLNSMLDHYKRPDVGVVMTQDNIKIRLASPSGRWEVYDGKISSNIGNTHYYKRNRALREVAYTDFKFNGQVFSFVEPTKGRMLNDTSALSAKANGQDYGGEIILRPSGFGDNMAFNWP